MIPEWSYLQEFFEVRVFVCLVLQQRRPVELAAAEPDVSLHVGQLGGQDIPDHLHRHLLAPRLLPHPQRPATNTLAHCLFPSGCPVGPTASDSQQVRCVRTAGASERTVGRGGSSATKLSRPSQPAGDVHREGSEKVVPTLGRFF